MTRPVDPEFGRLDVLCLSASLFFALDMLAAMVLVTPHFRAMLDPFQGCLPPPTQVALSWWFPTGVVVISLSATLLALLRIRARRWRLTVMAAAAAVGFGGVVGYFMGLFLVLAPL